MIDFKFIEQLEGFSCKGYVPDPQNSNSGVTIACGFDLGQRTEEELVHAFSPELASKFKPYAGITRFDAVAELDKRPLEITEEQAEQVFSYSQQQAVGRLTQLWDSSLAAIKFNQLANACQTVVASVAFQYGNLERRTPNFWQQVTNEKWHEALLNLRNFGDKYPTRRNKEADYLQAWLEGH